MSYQANNIRGQWKRAFCSATLVGMGGVGGIAGGLIFRFQDAPSYRPGLYACIACCILTLIIVGLITLSSWRLNKKADRGEIELEYHDVSLIRLRLHVNVTNDFTGGRPEGFPIYLLIFPSLRGHLAVP